MTVLFIFTIKPDTNAPPYHPHNYPFCHSNLLLLFLCFNFIVVFNIYSLQGSIKFAQHATHVHKIVKWIVVSSPWQFCWPAVVDWSPQRFSEDRPSHTECIPEPKCQTCSYRAYLHTNVMNQTTCSRTY